LAKVLLSSPNRCSIISSVVLKLGGVSNHNSSMRAKMAEPTACAVAYGRLISPTIKNWLVPLVQTLASGGVSGLVIASRANLMDFDIEDEGMNF